MNKEDWVKIMEELPNGRRICDVHKGDYNEIYLPVLAANMIGKPLFELLRKKGSCELIRNYCNAMEQMWREGDQEVMDALEMTILEHLSEDEVIWQRFGTYVSEDFRNYINEEVLEGNIMMSGVERLQNMEPKCRKAGGLYEGNGEREIR
ncbi:MAG: hypothetical protein HFI33_08520 [Lachnospiraceae bacterium]|nr:hypothetical protein [Lachnospiraceae bacterium]